MEGGRSALCFLFALHGLGELCATGNDPLEVNEEECIS